MATDFFQRQSDARRNTVWLVVLFAIAVIGIVGTVTVVTAVIVTSYNVDPESDDRLLVAIPALAGLATLLLIVGGTLFKVSQLRSGGGTVVAESLDGRRLSPDSTDLMERKLLNVVEEMAIAAGTPVPPVYFMNDEPGINAFAAGYSPSDAVIGVTRGCVENLSREELQGVIAHEFSHILNGDMKNSIQLMGILHGILLLGLLGQAVLRILAYSGAGRSRRSSKEGSPILLALMVISITMIVVGFIGTFFGNIIKAAVSRQREFLADASAVQFTRNPGGIANALRKIGGFTQGSKLKTANAAIASHMYFSIGVWEGFTGIWATHPPLERRIKAIDPSWDGNFDHPLPEIPTDARVSGFAGSTRPSQEVSLSAMDHAVEHVGEPTIAHQTFARHVVRSLPQELLAATRDPYQARSIVCCLLLDEAPTLRSQQLDMLKSMTTPDFMGLIKDHQPLIDTVDVRYRLPLVDLALPALRGMSITQYRTFIRSFEALIAADERLDLFEWILSQVLTRHLKPQFEPVSAHIVHYYSLKRLTSPLSILFSAIAYSGQSPSKAADAFQVAVKRFSKLGIQLVPTDQVNVGSLKKSLQVLSAVTEKQRGDIVDACAAIISFDQHVNWKEAELLRGVSDLLDCPMPPLLDP